MTTSAPLIPTIIISNVFQKRVPALKYITKSAIAMIPRVLTSRCSKKTAVIIPKKIKNGTKTFRAFSYPPFTKDKKPFLAVDEKREESQSARYATALILKNSDGRIVSPPMFIQREAPQS